MENKFNRTGAIIGFLVGIAVYIAISSMVDTLVIADLDWTEWIIVLVVIGTSTLTGSLIDVDEPKWKLIVKPLIVCVAAGILVLIIEMIIGGLSMASFFEVVVMLVILGLLSAPAYEVIILILEL